MQAGLSSTSTNRIFIIPEVDGGLISFGPYIGLIPQTSYAGFDWQDAATQISPGTHTLQTFVGSDNSAVVASYAVQAKIYVIP